MKKAFLFPLLFITLPTFAQTTPPTDADACRQSSALAAQIMEQRQSGMTRQEAHEHLKRIPGDIHSPAYMRFLEDAVTYQEAAYTVPVVSTDDDRAVAIRNFRDKAYQDCIR